MRMGDGWGGVVKFFSFYTSLFVVLLCVSLKAKTLLVRQAFRAGMSQHIARVPGGPVLIPGVRASAQVEQFAHTRRIFRFVFDLPGARTVVAFLPRACAASF